MINSSTGERAAVHNCLFSQAGAAVPSVRIIPHLRMKRRSAMSRAGWGSRDPGSASQGRGLRCRARRRCSPHRGSAESQSGGLRRAVPSRPVPAGKPTKLLFLLLVQTLRSRRRPGLRGSVARRCWCSPRCPSREHRDPVPARRLRHRPGLRGSAARRCWCSLRFPSPGRRHPAPACRHPYRPGPRGSGARRCWCSPRCPSP